MTIFKKFVSGKTFILLLLTFILVSNNSFSQLLKNGDFENSDTGIVSVGNVKGWLLMAAASINPLPVFEIVSDTVKQGNRALKISILGTGTNQWDIQGVADSIPVNQGSTYYYSIWAKAEKPGARVNFTVGNYSYSEYNAIRPATLSTQWQEYTMQFTVDDNNSFIRAPIHFSYSGNANNTIYIDNLNIEDVNQAKFPVIIEAESGIVGSYFQINTDDDLTSVTTSSNYTGQSAPNDSNRMITCQVTFQDTGFYNLFARI